MNPLILILLIVLLVFGAVIYTNMTAEANAHARAIIVTAQAQAQATTIMAYTPIVIAGFIALSLLPASIGAMVHLMRRREPEKIVQREILILPEGSTRRDVWRLMETSLRETEHGDMVKR